MSAYLEPISFNLKLNYSADFMTEVSLRKIGCILNIPNMSKSLEIGFYIFLISLLKAAFMLNQTKEKQSR